MQLLQNIEAKYETKLSSLELKLDIILYKIIYKQKFVVTYREGEIIIFV